MIKRINRLRELLCNDQTAILITSDINRFYFTGFRSSAGVLLVCNSKATLLLDFRYYEDALNKVDKCVDVVCYKKIYDSINDISQNYGIKTLLIEDDDVTVSRLNRFKTELRCEIDDSFSLSDKLLSMRMIKTEDEVNKIITAQNIAEKSYLELLNSVKPGVSEKKLAVELEYLMKLYGAEKIAFDLITISGKNTSLPHGVPGDKLLDNGDFITFDIGAVYGGYHSDMTRTVALGYTSDEMADIYSIVLTAHNKATEKILPDNTCADVDNAARDYITEKGYGEYFGHTTGHGVGLEIHEKPTVYHTDKTILRPGMIITNEPGIYLPHKFGVRIEDMYLVTDGGCKDLATIDKELIIL